MKTKPNVSHLSMRWILSALLFLPLVFQPVLTAQEDADEVEEFELSPFIVTGDSDSGYLATQTLAGTRFRSEVRDVGSAMTIFTQEFLDDIGATNFEEILEYAPNTSIFEAGAINNPDGLSTRNQNTYSVRGFTNTSLSRDFFRSLYRPDIYSTERMTFSRGPNSILFGVAQPGGVTNSVSKRARHNREIYEFSNRIDDEGSMRLSMDINKPVIEDVLAIRVAALKNEQRYWRFDEFEDGIRTYVAANLRPFGKTDGWFSDLDINFNYEKGETDSQRLGRSEPIYDEVTPWIEAGRPLIETVIGTTTGDGGGVTTMSNAPVLIVIEQSPLPGSQVPNLSWRRMAKGVKPSSSQGDQSRNMSLLDESIMPFDVNYLGGSRRYSDTFNTTQLILTKEIIKNLHFEGAINRQDYDRNSIEELRGPSLRVDANMYLPNADPDIKIPNPNAGRFYMDTPIVRNQPFGRNVSDTYRASLSYEIDFNRGDNFLRHLGHLRAAIAYEDNEDKLDRQWTQLQNLTPALTNATLGLAGGTAFNARIQHPRNRAKFRHYLDPAAGYWQVPSASEAYGYPDAYYADDPIPDNQADESGVTLGFIADFPGFNTITETKSKVGALQWFFLNDRIVGTFGWREDEQKSWNANGLIAADTNPVTGIRPDPRPYNPKDDPDSLIVRKGETTTTGVVAFPLEWLGVFYNKSDNFVPVGQQFDIYGEIFPNQTGEGKDYGIKFFLWENKLTASVTWFETSAENQATGHIRAGARGVARPFNGSTDTMWDTIAAYTEDSKYSSSPYAYSLGPFWGALQSIDSEGIEIQLVYNPTREWRIMLNYSEQEGVYTGIGPRLTQYFDEFVPAEWQSGWDSIPLDNPVTFTTGEVNTVGELRNAIEADIDRIKTLEGTADTRQPLSSFNLVTSYTFSKDSKLNGWSIGGTARWRGDRFIGFPFDDDGVALDPNNPYKDGSTFYLDAMIRYRRELFNNSVDWSIQVNVRNLLNDTDFLPFQVAGDRSPTIARWSFQTPRTIQLTNTIRF